MILGVGTDLIEIDRIEKALKNPRFLKRYFTSEEQKFFSSKKNPYQSIAASFSAKEAVSKAMGTGFRGFGAEDIEVLRNEKGKPFINLLEKADLEAQKLGIKTFHLSLSHSKEYAIAFVIAEGGEINENCENRSNEIIR